MDSCPICFEDFEQKIRASPDACDHVFCLPCLEKWSKLGNYCPVDRKRYKKIFNLDSEDVIQVKTRKRKREKTVYDFTTKCEICSKDSDENVLLLCDCCDLGFHMHCLSPPLKAVPSGQWFCHACVSVEEKLKKQNGITKEIELEFGISHKGLVVDNQLKKEFPSKKKIEEIKISRKLDSESNLKACHVVLDLNDIDTKKNVGQKTCNSVIFDNSSNNIGKLGKSFESKSCSTNSKLLKTYNVPNTYKTSSTRPPGREQMKRRLSRRNNTNITDMLLLNNNEQVDIDLLDRYLTESAFYGSMKVDTFNNSVDDDASEMRTQKCNINKNDLSNGESTTIECHLDGNFSESPCENPLKERHKRLRSPLENRAQHDTNGCSSKNNVSRKINHLSQKTAEESSSSNEASADRKHTITSEALGSELCSNLESIETPKGTFNNLFSESLNGNLKEHSEEKLQFSVFEGIVSPQKICSQFMSAPISFTTNISVLHCAICKDKIFAKSQKHCKICKLKSIKKSVFSEKFSKCVKIAKKMKEKKGLEDNIKPFSVIFDNQRYIKKNTLSVLERRQRSLAHTVKKLCSPKKKCVIPM